MSKPRTAWAKKCQIAMVEKGYDTRDIADKTGLNIRYVSAITNGRQISKPAISKISMVLGISDTNDPDK